MSTDPATAPRTAQADLGRLRIDRNRRPEGPGRWRLVVLAGAILLLVAAALVFRFRTAGAVTVEETAVVLRPSAGGGADGILTANGYIQARRSAAVSAEVQGRLLYLYVEEGSRVEKGTLLAQLANEDLAARVARAEADLAVRRTLIAEAQAERTEAENARRRAQTLHERGLATAAELDAAQARDELIRARIATAEKTQGAAEAELRLARADLAKTYIRAPFTGTVLRKNAEVGEMVAPVSLGGTGSRGAIVTIASLDSLDVEVDVNEAYIGRLRLGQAARVATDAYPDTAFAARVRQIVPTSDRQKATVLVKTEILDPDSRLLPEMGAKVTFLANRDPAVDAAIANALPTVADGAVQRTGATPFVWLVRPDGTVEERSVRLGRTVSGRTEIISGLVGGETVVVRVSRPLRNGAKVRLPSSGG